MLSLNGIGKGAVIRHHREMHLSLLEPVRDLSNVESTSDGSLIVQGDSPATVQRPLGKKASAVYPSNATVEGSIRSNRRFHVSGWLISKSGLERCDR
jgi:hypothetical protein